METLALWCGAPALPYTSHLRQVTVPVLYVGAAGGTGRYGLYSLSLLGSKDITLHHVQLYRTPGARMDFGHMDLFTADGAPTLVWARHRGTGCGATEARRAHSAADARPRPSATEVKASRCAPAPRRSAPRRAGARRESARSRR